MPSRALAIYLPIRGSVQALFRPLVRMAYRVLLKGGYQRIIFQNQEDQQTFLKWGLADKDVTYLIRGSGVDCARFRPPDISNQRRGFVRVLFASRLLRDKGVWEFVEAARLARAHGTEAEFLLAGDVYEANPSS